MEEIYIKTDNIKLDSFLKLAGEASTGGEAKKLILNGFVKIADEVCCKRGKKILPNTEISVSENKYKVVKE